MLVPWRVSVLIVLFGTNCSHQGIPPRWAIDPLGKGSSLYVVQLGVPEAAVLYETIPKRSLHIYGFLYGYLLFYETIQ